MKLEWPPACNICRRTEQIDLGSQETNRDEETAAAYFDPLRNPFGGYQAGPRSADFRSRHRRNRTFQKPADQRRSETAGALWPGQEDAGPHQVCPHLLNAGADPGARESSDPRLYVAEPPHDQ